MAFVAVLQSPRLFISEAIFFQLGFSMRLKQIGIYYRNGRFYQLIPFITHTEWNHSFQETDTISLNPTESKLKVDEFN